MTRPPAGSRRRPSIELLRLPPPPRPRLQAAPGAWPPPPPLPPPMEVQLAAIVHELARGGLV